MQQAYSPFYTFLTYLQLGSIILTFVMLIIGIIGGILAIRALLIYMKKNRILNEEKEAVHVEDVTVTPYTETEDDAVEDAEPILAAGDEAEKEEK